MYFEGFESSWNFQIIQKAQKTPKHLLDLSSNIFMMGQKKKTIIYLIQF